MGFSLVAYSEEKKNQSSSGFSLADYEKQKVSEDILAGNFTDIDKSYDSLVNNVTSLGQDIDANNKKFGTGYVDKHTSGPYSHVMSSKIESLLVQAKKAQTHYTQHAPQYDQKYGAGTSVKLINSSKSMVDYLQAQLNSTKAFGEYWNQFDNEEDYHYYGLLPTKEDFAEKSQYKSTYVGGEEYNPFAGSAGYYRETGFTDLEYDYINKNEKARDIFYINNMSNGSVFTGTDNRYLEHISDEEIAIYNYLYATEGPESAEYFIKHIKKGLNLRQRVAAQQNLSEYAKEHPIISSISSVLISPLKGLSYVGQLVDYVSSGEIDENAAYNQWSYIPSTIRETVSETIQDTWAGKFGSGVYNLGMSMGDFLFASAITGGNSAAVMTILGTGAAADATLNAKERGLSDGRAILEGTLAGVIEAVTEKIGFDAAWGKLGEKFLKGGKLTYAINNALAEASEEGLSDIANWFVDGLIGGDSSQWDIAIDNYIAQGMTPSEALKKVFWERAGELGFDFLGGLVSGGTIAGGTLGINSAQGAISNYKDVSSLGKEYLASNPSYRDFMINTVEGGLKADTNSEYFKIATAINDKFENGKSSSITEHEIGQLLLAQKAYTENQTTTDATNAITEQLMTNGANEITAQKVAPILQSLSSGAEISGSQASLIATTPAAIDYLNQTYGTQINTDAPLSELKAQIKKLSTRNIGQRAVENSADNSIGQSYQSEVEGAILGQNSASGVSAVELTNEERLMRYADEVNLGDKGRQTITAMYDGSSDFVNFAGAFTAYYQAGVSGMPISAVKFNLSSAVSDNVKQAAYLSGQMDAIVQNNGQRNSNPAAQVNSTLPNTENNDTINKDDLDFEVIDDHGEEAERNTSSSRDGERTDGVVARKSGGSVQSRTAKAQARAETQRRRAKSIKNNVNAQGVERVSTASRGISIGTDNPTLQVVPRELYTEEMKAISKEQFDKGRRVTFFVGHLEMKENGETFTARGALSKDGKRIWIQADHPSLTIEQLAKHEEFHALIKKDTGLLDRTRRQIIAQYSEAQLQELVDSYVDAYGWTELSDNEILEEILADAYAEIDVFEHLSTYEGATRFSDAVQESAKSVQDTSSGIENNTGQEQFSRNPAERNRALQKGEMINKYYKMVNWPMYYEKLKGAEYTPDNFDDGELAFMMLDGMKLTLEMQENGEFSVVNVEVRRNGYSSSYRRNGKKGVPGKRSGNGDRYNRVVSQSGRSGRQGHGDGGEGTYTQRDGEDASADDSSKSSALTEKFSRSSPTITQENIRELRSIGRKSVNAFTAEDIKKAEPFARRAWQELGVKSPFFRTWFGDWRSADIKSFTEPVDIPQGVKLNTDSRMVQNKDTGWSIQVNNDLNNDSLHYAGKDKLYIERLLTNIDEVISNSIYLDTAITGDAKSNKKGSSAFIHYFYSVVEYQGAPFLAKISVEEYDVDSKRRAYNATRIKMSTLSRAQFSQLKAVNRGKYASSVDSLSVAQLFELVKEYDAKFSPKPVNPVLLNEDGTPKKFYHGTGEQFTIFSYDELRQREGSFFFAENKEDAAAYGDNVFEVYLSGEKLADYDGQPSEFYHLKDKREQVEWLKKRGYDGWYSDMDDGWGEVSVFSPNQIKSANDNIGTFDAGNPDIRFSRETSLYLQEENERIRKEYQATKRKLRDMKKQRDYWKDEATTAPILDRDDVKAVTEHLLSSYSSKADKTATFNALKELGEFIIRGGDRTADLEWSVVKEKAVDIARNILENSSELVDDGNRATYKEIRNYLRTTKLHITQSLKNEIGFLSNDYNTFRKRNMGRLSLSFAEGIGVDTAYQELQSKYGTALFPDTITNDADQLMHLAELVPTLQDVYENPYSYDMAEAIEFCACDIIDQLMSEDIRQRETRAVKQNRKLVEAKAKLGKLRTEKNARIEAIKQHYRDVAQKQRTRRAESKERARLLNIVRRLKNKKLPAVQRGLLNQYIGEIDTVAVSMTGKTVEKLQDLYMWYTNEKETNPDFLGDERTEKMLRRLSQRQIKEMTIEEVAELTQVLLNIENEIRTQRKLIDSQERRDVYLAGVQTIENIQNAKATASTGISKLIGDYIVAETLSPERMIRRMTGYNETDPLYIATQELSRGQRAKMDYQMRRYHEFSQWTENKPFMKNMTGKKALEITVTAHQGDMAVKVRITPAMRMSLYLHSLNRQNMRHIQYGGVTIPDMDLYKKGKITEAYNRGKLVQFTKSEIAQMAESMTDTEKVFVRAVQKYYNTVSQESVNEVSEKLLGYSVALVENYFPLDVDTNFTKADFASIKYDGTVEGMGFLKERINSSAPIYLRDVTDVLLKSIEQHSMYVGMAIPIRNFNKLWGVTSRSFSEDGTRLNIDSSVQKAIREHWGEQGYKYVEKFMRDISNPHRDQGILSKALSKVRSRYAGAVLTLNASVALKQAASYPTAAAVLGFKPLARAMADIGKVDLNLINKYTPLLWYRSMGFSTTELADMKKNGINLPPALNWIQGVDLLTTRKLWKASEYYVRQNNRELKIASDEYYKAVAEIYNRVIEETQPNYATMQRPQSLRSDSTLLQSVLMFKTQPFQNFNILYDAFGNLHAKKKAAQTSNTEQAQTEYKDAKKKAAWAATSQLTQLAVFAGMTFIWSMFRGRRDKYEDEEGNMTVGSATAGIGKDMIGGMASIIPFGSDVWELAGSLVFGDTYYGFDSVTDSAISDFLGAIQQSYNAISDIVSSLSSGEDVDWNDKRFDLDKIVTSFSTFLGIPTDNVQKLFGAIYLNAAKATGGRYKGEYAYLKLTVSPTDKAQAYYDNLFDAYLNDKEAYEDIVLDMLESGFFTEDKIRKAMDKRLKDEQGVTKVTKLDQRYLLPNEQERYDDIFDGVDDSNLWDRATAEQRQFTRELLYDLAVQTPDGIEDQDKIDRSGLSETEYVLYKLALQMVDEPNESGNLGTYTGAEKQAAIALIGISKSKAAGLWDVESKTENPYK